MSNLAFLSNSWSHLLGRPTICLLATHSLLGNFYYSFSLAISTITSFALCCSGKEPIFKFFLISRESRDSLNSQLVDWVADFSKMHSYYKTHKRYVGSCILLSCYLRCFVTFFIGFKNLNSCWKNYDFSLLHVSKFEILVTRSFLVA